MTDCFQHQKQPKQDNSSDHGASMANAMRYMFVECQDPVKIKLRNPRGSKSTARSHVTKEFHRKRRLEMRKTFAAGATAQMGTSPSLETAVKKESGEDEEDALEVVPYHRPELIPSISNAVARNSIHSILSQSRTDPFNSLPVDDMPPFGQLLLDHALTITWPETVPAKRGYAVTNPVRAAWLESARDSPVLFHAFLFSAGLQVLTMCNGRELVQSAYSVRLGHYQKAISLVNQHIRELNGPPSDALIMAVLCLTVHGSRAESPGIECHPQSPLATQQYLHVYGQILAEEKHVLGLQELVQRKGGAEEVKTYGMACTVNLCDLYHATRRVEKPRLPLPWQWHTKSLIAAGNYTPDSTTLALTSIIGSSFEYLCATSPGAGFWEVVTNVTEVILALDQHTRRTPQAPDIVDILPLRNAVQHQLLSFDVMGMDGDIEDRAMAEICRVSALIFSDMVVFPMPAIQRVKPALATRLKTLLCGLALKRLRNSGHWKTLVWVTTLGSIASTFTEDHGWFLQQLNIHLAALMLRNWHELRSLCLTFFWWPPVCDPPGQVTWSEVEQLAERESIHTVHR